MLDSPAYNSLLSHCRDIGGECAQAAEESDSALIMTSQHIYPNW